MNQAKTGTGGQTAPGELMRLTARGLAAHGFRVAFPERDEARYLTVTGSTGETSALSVLDTGNVQWEFPAREGRDPDPREVADIVTGLLAGHIVTGQQAGSGTAHEYLGGHGIEDLAFRGIVGLELRARGLSVTLDVYADDEFLDVEAELVVTNPSTGTDAEVRIKDDGTIGWERCYALEYGIITWEPEYSVQLAHHETIAGDITGKITQAMSDRTHVSEG